jgi:hypothetical protein
MTNLFLFASFGFFEGMGRVVDLAGTLAGYNRSPTIEEADNRALASDWQAIADDFKHVMKKYAQAQKTEE